MNNENVTPVKKPISTLQLLIVVLTISLFSVSRAIANLPLSAVALVIFAYGAYKLCKNKKLLAIILLVVGGALFVASPETIDNSIIVASTYLALIGAVALGGFMLCNGVRGILLYVAFSAATCGAVYLITGEPTAALEVLRTLPCTVVLAICKKKKTARLSALCAVSATFLASLYLPELIVAFLQYGSQTLDQLKTTIDTTREELIKEITAASKEIGGEGDPLYSPEFIRSIVTLIFNILPALLITVSNAVVFFVQTCFFALTENFGDSVSKEERAFELSTVSAWMFFISFGVMFITVFFNHPTAEIISLTMMNVNLILVPAFLVISILAFTAFIKKSGARPSPLTVIIIVLVALNFGTFLLYPVAGFGAVSTIKKSSKSGNKEHRESKPE